ncbi:MAG TPA: hypothetical protein PLI09_07735 [Candidatus Hydrogenedentes bacterium]|nr:hypothetical protein [Candidatus Hydrogenedentota bacterium]
MSIGDYVQLGVLIVMAASLVVMTWQTLLQNRLVRAQVLRDRFEMYWKTYEPATDEKMEDFKLYPKDYIDPLVYKQRYCGNDKAIKKYIYMSQLYEYLVFVHLLGELKIPDPIGHHWLVKWAEELVHSREFRDVHDYYKGYYPTFEKLIDNLIAKVKREGKNLE